MSLGVCRADHAIVADHRAGYFEAAQSLLAHGFKRFLLLNAHGGNQAITRDIVERINQETAGIAVDLSEAVAPLLTRTTAATPFTGTVSRLKRPHSRLRSIVTAASEKRPPRYLTPTLVISTPRRPRR